MLEKPNTILPVLVAGLLVAACSTSTPAPPIEDTTALDKAVVGGMTDRILTAWNAGNAAALERLVAPDVIMMSPDGPSPVGRETVVKSILGNYDTAVMKQSATVGEVTLAGDHGYAFGTWSLDPKPGVTTATPAARGKWSALYKRAPDGTWQVWRWMWNQEGAQPSAGG